VVRRADLVAVVVAVLLMAALAVVLHLLDKEMPAVLDLVLLMLAVVAAERRQVEQTRFLMLPEPVEPVQVLIRLGQARHRQVAAAHIPAVAAVLVVT
jgi:membrane glycosyltransferase